LRTLHFCLSIIWLSKAWSSWPDRGVSFFLITDGNLYLREREYFHGHIQGVVLFSSLLWKEFFPSQCKRRLHIFIQNIKRNIVIRRYESYHDVIYFFLSRVSFRLGVVWYFITSWMESIDLYKIIKNILLIPVYVFLVSHDLIYVSIS